MRGEGGEDKGAFCFTSDRSLKSLNRVILSNSLEAISIVGQDRKGKSQGIKQHLPFNLHTPQTRTRTCCLDSHRGVIKK